MYNFERFYKQLFPRFFYQCWIYLKEAIFTCLKDTSLPTFGITLNYNWKPKPGDGAV